MTGPVSHPPWCDPDRCGVSAGRPAGTHCSRLVRLGPQPPATIVAEVSLAQGPAVAGFPRTGHPYVTLALGDADDELLVTPLDVELARAVGRVLIGFAQEAAG
jgi:hypothetical protein